MPNYVVTYGIDIEAETPLDAAYAVDWLMQRENRAYEPVFTVTEHGTHQKMQIDLDAYLEEDQK